MCLRRRRLPRRPSTAVAGKKFDFSGSALMFLCDWGLSLSFFHFPPRESILLLLLLLLLVICVFFLSPLHISVVLSPLSSTPAVMFCLLLSNQMKREIERRIGCGFINSAHSLQPFSSSLSSSPAFDMQADARQISLPSLPSHPRNWITAPFQILQLLLK